MSVLQAVNVEPRLRGDIESGPLSYSDAPVLACPLAAVGAAGVAKAAGVVVGGGAVTGVAYVAYKTVAN
ncbi:hypothetical protein CKW39_13500 [Kocuria sp. WRN011]|uniref:Uncharacterized protein n=1 Tax=Kocuria carniphila TaxID=262208 RepID=A0ABV3V6Q3_9MICC|nr:hypothetical protein [Kocuria sp. WRN011]PBB07532.1 hypothetical protein CKW39_13500 [Kocuria sp. WRN011]